jgi:hypothetical protein
MAAVLLFYPAASVMAQGSNGGLLYASDFAAWSLPQGTGPAQGTIAWPSAAICTVSTVGGYSFIAPKVGRSLTIVDNGNPGHTETVIPSQVQTSPTCSLNALMTYPHLSYSVKSGTAGLQEALDYQANLTQGAVVVLTPAWTLAGGTTTMITGAHGYSNVSILDQRTSVYVPYTWNGTVYVPSPFASSIGDKIQEFTPFTVDCGNSNGYAMMTSAAVATLPGYQNKCLVPFSCVSSTGACTVNSGQTNIVNECIPNPNSNLASSVTSSFAQIFTIWSNGTNWEASCPSTSTNLAPIYVTSYGAVGDGAVVSGSCTGTDNTAAIQAAINAAALTGGSIFLPANPTSTNNQTIYRIAGTLLPKSVSIFGQPGAGGNIFYSGVNICGAPGKDVFATGDPSAPGFFGIYGGWAWQDFGIIVDDSEDVSSSKTHRKPGKTCPDVTATLDSYVVTSAQCKFTAGDIGQNVSLTDGTNTLTTTIASIGPLGGAISTTTATLAAEWTYATHANSTMYVAIAYQSLAQRIGNCALAADDTATGGLSGGSFNATLRNLSITTTSGSYQNNSCAIFLQGLNGQPYNTIFQSVFGRTVWGFNAVESDGLGAGVTNGAMGDGNRFQNVFFEGDYPWVTYDGGDNTFSGQLAGFIDGPQILNYGEEQENYADLWSISPVEFTDATPPINMGWRIDGYQHHILQTSIAYPSTHAAQWGAQASACYQCGLEGGELSITGSLNVPLQFTDGSASTLITDTGIGNQCSVSTNGNPLAGIQPALAQSCSAINSRQGLAFGHTAEFTDGNMLTPYNNRTDLNPWPQDLDYSGAVPLIDSTSPTGTYLLVSSASGLIDAVNQGVPVVGQALTGPNLPATKIDLCATMRADSGSGTGTVELWVNNSYVAEVTHAVTTSYGTWCTQGINLTGDAGLSVQYYLAASGASVRFADIRINPWKDWVNSVGPVTGSSVVPSLIYSAAGTALAACASGNVGTEAVVSDASALTPGTAYSVSAGAGSDATHVQCTLTGSTYAWYTM